MSSIRQSSLHRLNQKPSSAIQSNPRHSADDARQSNPSPSVSRPSFRPKPDQLWPSHRQTQPIKSDSSFTEQSLPFSETKDVNDSTHDLERREIEAKPFSERYLAVKQPKSFQVAGLKQQKYFKENTKIRQMIDSRSKNGSYNFFTVSFDDNGQGGLTRLLSVRPQTKKLSWDGGGGRVLPMTFSVFFCDF